MQNRDIDTPSGSEARLLQGENPDTRHATDARRWIGIYGQLLAFNEELLGRLHRDVGDDGRRGLDVDDRIAEWELTRLRERLSFWQGRHRELAGVDLDEATGILYGAEGAVALTTREAQLLNFLLQRPGHYFVPSVLSAQAWHDPRLASEQVRSYVVRLRRRLAEAQVPCRIDSRRGLGYRLTFEGGEDGGGVDRPEDAEGWEEEA
jgi:DNA-binding winged helix-turn-helix (wHTH) protein